MKPVVYQLLFFDDELSYPDYRECFDIGIFSSMNKARETADFYSAHVEGFKDYDCSYDIIEKKVIGELSGDCVYGVSGWNVNENLDEVEIIESECFSHEAAATQYMVQQQKMQKRTNWCVSRYIVDESLWKEGFTRYQY